MLALPKCFWDMTTFPYWYLCHCHDQLQFWEYLEEQKTIHESTVYILLRNSNHFPLEAFLFAILKRLREEKYEICWLNPKIKSPKINTQWRRQSPKQNINTWIEIHKYKYIKCLWFVLVWMRSTKCTWWQRLEKKLVILSLKYLMKINS